MRACKPWQHGLHKVLLMCLHSSTKGAINSHSRKQPMNSIWLLLDRRLRTPCSIGSVNQTLSYPCMVMKGMVLLVVF